MRCVIEFANYQKEQIYNSEWMPDYDKKDRLSIVNATIKEYRAGMIPAQEAMRRLLTATD